MKHLLLFLLFASAALAGPTSSTVSVEDSATAVLPAITERGHQRTWVTISVPSTATEPVYWSTSAAVTTSSGHELQPGETITLTNNAEVHAAWSAIYAIAETGPVTIILTHGD